MSLTMNFLVVFLSLISLAVLSNAFLWSSFSKTRSGDVRMASASVLENKTLKLSKIKGKHEGRYDLDSMADENIEEIADYGSFAIADDEEIDPPKLGQIITGTVLEMDDNGALLEIGGKMSGYLPVKEASLQEIKSVNSFLKIGDEVTAEVIGTLKGMPVLSMRPALLLQAWEVILGVRAADSTFEVKVSEINKGGAVVDAFNLKAFLPGSHFVGVPDASLIGSTLKVKFLDVIEDEGKLVVSQKRALYDGANEMKRGEVVNATVTGLRPYGAFLEIDGGMAGLLHISQISSDRIESLEKVFTIGQRTKVMILDHDKANGRVALSTKTLEANPGEMLRDMAGVFERALETAAKYHERVEGERLAREAAAKDIVAGLGGALDEPGSDPLVSVAESIESILASIVSEAAPNANA